MLTVMVNVPRSRKRAFHLPWIASDVYCAFCAGEQEARAWFLQVERPTAEMGL